MLEVTALLLALSTGLNGAPAEVEQAPAAIVAQAEQIADQIVIATTPEPEPEPEPAPEPQPEPKPDPRPPYVAPYGRVLATCVTKTTTSANRNTNIYLASTAINEYVVEPGAEFSFNAVVGQRTAARGYKEAGVYSGGKADVGIGGGICQVSSTLFNAALQSNMTITMRRAHSLPVSYLPRGLDATVSWGVQDFKFVNPYSTPVMVCTYFNPNEYTLTVSIKGREDIALGDVQVNVTQKNGTYTTTRTVDGTVNYTTTSRYGSH